MADLAGGFISSDVLSEQKDFPARGGDYIDAVPPVVVPEPEPEPEPDPISPVVVVNTFSGSGSLVSTEQYSDIQKAKLSMLTAHAEGSHLNVIGQNAGIPRPVFLTDDVMYSKIVRLLSWQPKQILFTIRALLGIVFGTPEEIEAAGGRSWDVFCVRAHEIVIEVPGALLGSVPERVSYTHGWSGFALDSTSDTEFSAEGDLSTAAEATLVGANIYFFIEGVWEGTKIDSLSYDSGTGISSLVLNSALSTADYSGVLFYVEVKESASYRGDFIAPSAFAAPFVADAGVSTDTVVVPGDAKVHLNVDHTITLTYGATEVTRSIDVIADYDHTTNSTTITLDSDIDGGVAGVLFRALEEAGGADTAPVADRVYDFSGGLYLIVEFYLDLLMLSAGVVARLEIVGE